MTRKSKLYLSVLALILPLGLMAQATITGSVTSEDGAALAGANVIVEGTSLGAAADASGNYNINGVSVGNVTVTASFVGYESSSSSVSVPASGSVTVNFSLSSGAIELSGLEVLASRVAKNAPVAHSNIDKKEMDLRLGSQDIPLVLNTTPNVYSTGAGGGAGDARINVRGFDQRNTAIMINGVPVNDMENAWVYWSNWDGVGDATSSIQMQRGLSAVNLATPSIGGSMNVITDPTSQQRSFSLKTEIGEWGFQKVTFVGSSGLIADKFAFNLALVKKQGDGFVEGTWSDASAWYFGASAALNDKNRLEFYALAAPQRHGNRYYAQNIAAYSEEYALSLSDYDSSALHVKYGYWEADNGYQFNQNWAPVTDYSGKQTWNEQTDDRYSSAFINSRENFYNKPIANLNWFSELSDNMRLSSVFYWSGGHGGGTGTAGSVEQFHALATDRVAGVLPDSASALGVSAFYKAKPWVYDWDGTIANNQASTSGSLGILRNSRNNQSTIGLISKFAFDLNDALTLGAGIDWRTADIEHYREIRDLLGGEYLIDTSSEFEVASGDTSKTAGDKVFYNFSNSVDWLGFYGQLNYDSGPISAWAMYGLSNIAYTYTNHYLTADTLANGNPDPDSGELTAETGNIPGTQLKTGLSYSLMDGLTLWGNYGTVSAVPIFDDVIDDYAGAMVEDPTAVNATFMSTEFGVNWSGGNAAVNVNYYNTVWEDRSTRVGVVDEEGNEGLVSIRGVDQSHSGVELQLAFQPMDMLRLDAVYSKGDWYYTDNVTAVYHPDISSAPEDYDTMDVYIKDLKVGNQPQTQMVFIASLFPIEGLTAQLIYRNYSDHYANFDPFSRANPYFPDSTKNVDENGGIITDDEGNAVTGDRGVDSWKVPDFSVIDLHLSYDLPISLGGVKLQAFAHIFNLLDEIFIQDATDNSKYNAWDNDHDADDAEVFFGLPMNFNAGLVVRF